MKVLGRHALVDVYECDPVLLDDFDYIKTFLHDVTSQLHLTVVQSTFHRFSPQGVSGVIVIAESHLSVHTWPELGYAAFDLYTCDDATPLSELPELLRNALKAKRVDVSFHNRGIIARGKPVATEEGAS